MEKKSIDSIRNQVFEAESLRIQSRLDVIEYLEYQIRLNSTDKSLKLKEAITVQTINGEELIIDFIEVKSDGIFFDCTQNRTFSQRHIVFSTITLFEILKAFYEEGYNYQDE